MSGNPWNCSCVVLSHDPAVITSLSYLLTVVLKCSTEAISDVADIAVAFGRESSPDVLFIYADAENQTGLAQAAAVRAQGLSTIVIALLKDLPVLGAKMYEDGADDVVHWPVDLKEIAFRLRHHMGKNWHSDAVIDLNADWEAEAYIAKVADLTVAETQILRVLMAKDGQIVTRDELSQIVDARPWRHGDRKFDVHMAKIRKKLSDTFGEGVTVYTIRSRGYRLSTSGSAFFLPTAS